MKAWFVWPDCKYSFHNNEWNNNPIDSFWISANESEVRKFIFDKLSVKDKNLFQLAAGNVEFMDGWYRGHRDPDFISDNDFRFLISKDLSRVGLGFAVYPYSDMWGMYNPFLDVLLEISSLEELKEL